MGFWYVIVLIYGKALTPRHIYHTDPGDRCSYHRHDLVGGPDRTPDSEHKIKPLKSDVSGHSPGRLLEPIPSTCSSHEGIALRGLSNSGSIVSSGTTASTLNSNHRFWIDLKSTFRRLDFIGLVLVVVGFGLFFVEITSANSRTAWWFYGHSISLLTPTNLPSIG
jgi:hypothetical protein